MTPLEVAVLVWAAVVVMTLRLMPAGDDMTQDAVKRAIQGAARQAFAMGKSAAQQRGADIESLKQQAVTYAEELVLPMVGLALEEAREEQWIENHGKRTSAPDPTL